MKEYPVPNPTEVEKALLAERWYEVQRHSRCKVTFYSCEREVWLI